MGQWAQPAEPLTTHGPQPLPADYSSVVAAPYPLAVAGEVRYQRWDPKKKVYELRVQIAKDPAVARLGTEVFFSQIHFPEPVPRWRLLGRGSVEFFPGSYGNGGSVAKITMEDGWSAFDFTLGKA